MFSVVLVGTYHHNTIMVITILYNLIYFKLLLSGKTQITYKSLRNSLYIGNSAFFFEIQAPLIK